MIFNGELDLVLNYNWFSSFFTNIFEMEEVFMYDIDLSVNTLLNGYRSINLLNLKFNDFALKLNSVTINCSEVSNANLLDISKATINGYTGDMTKLSSNIGRVRDVMDENSSLSDGFYNDVNMEDNIIYSENGVTVYYNESGKLVISDGYVDHDGNLVEVEYDEDYGTFLFDQCQYPNVHWGHGSGLATIANNGCSLTSAAAGLCMLGFNCTPISLWNRVDETQTSNIADTLMALSTVPGIEMKTEDHTTLVDNLSDGWLALVNVGGHICLATGVECDEQIINERVEELGRYSRDTYIDAGIISIFDPYSPSRDIANDKNGYLFGESKYKEGEYLCHGFGKKIISKGEVYYFRINDDIEDGMYV